MNTIRAVVVLTLALAPLSCQSDSLSVDVTTLTNDSFEPTGYATILRSDPPRSYRPIAVLTTPTEGDYTERLRVAAQTRGANAVVLETERAFYGEMLRPGEVSAALAVRYVEDGRHIIPYTHPGRFIEAVCGEDAIQEWYDRRGSSEEDVP